MLGSPYDTAIAAQQRHAVDVKQIIPDGSIGHRMRKLFDIQEVLPAPGRIEVWLFS